MSSHSLDGLEDVDLAMLDDLFDASIGSAVDTATTASVR